MSYNPHEIVKKICSNCGNEFESPRFHNKLYCSNICKRRVKADRVRMRDLNKTAKINQGLDARFLQELTNPSKMELDAWANVLLTTESDKVIKLLGNIPLWTPPSGVRLVEQVGSDEWIMLRQDEPDIMDIFKSKP